MSLPFYTKHFSRMTSAKLHPTTQHFSTANNSPLNVAGHAEFPVKVAGQTTFHTFFVVDGLSQDVILGIGFMQKCGVVLDYHTKRMHLFNGARTVPLVTAVDCQTAIRTIKRIRIPAHSEVIFTARLPCNPQSSDGITESLPGTLAKGLKVAGALVNCAQNTTVCRVANPTARPILWPAGHAFAYLSPIDTRAVGVHLIDTTEFVNEDTANTFPKQHHAEGGRDDERVRPCGRDPPPPHGERLRVLRELGVTIGENVMNQTQAEAMSQLLYEFRDIMACSYKDVPEARVPRHQIPLIDDKPLAQKRFRYDPAKELKLEALCDELLEADIIEESKSPWNSPVFLMRKPDGTSRFLVDFRGVNAKTKPEFCALPSLEDVMDQIAQEKPTIFSVLDLKAGYYGIGIDENSRPCTAFSTKNRHFQFTRLNMGYVNSGSFFTQSLYQIFAAEVRRNMIIYVDDIFIMHRDVDEHIKFLGHIFAKFREYKLRLHPKKMTIATDTANFLGYTLTAGGYTVDTGRCKIVKEYPRPKNARDTKKFLGIANYFKRLIKNYSKRSAPLRELLVKDKVFEWTDAQEQSFCDIRDALCAAPVLGYPDRDKPLRVILDACATGLGYILVNVNSDGSETALFFGGRSTTRAERNYSATELELSALLAAVKTFWSYLANVEFEIVTDHISLTYLKGLRAGPSKLARASAQLAQFKFKVTHLAGKKNSAADAISRTTDLQTDPLTAHEAARFQVDDIADLRLDYATTDDARDKDRGSKSCCDVGVQCDIRLLAETGGGEPCDDVKPPDDWPIACVDLDWSCDTTHPCRCSAEYSRHASLATLPKPQRSRRATARSSPIKQNSGAVGSADCSNQTAVNYDTEHTTEAANASYIDVINNTGVSTASIDTHNAQPENNSSDTTGNADAATPADSDNITLHKQSQDSTLNNIIQYLQRGELPQDTKTARRVLLTKDQFVIRNDQLLHLGIKRQKNNQTDQPIAEQVCVPRDLQPAILARYHAQLLHCGYEKMYLSLKQRVYWDNMYTDVRNYVANCETCQMAKTNTHPTRAALQCREVPPQIFERVHIDHVMINVKGATHGYKYAFVMVDAMSLNCEIVPVKTTSAAETCRVLLKDWIAKYGVFSELVSDRHASFTSKLTRLLTEACGIRHILISPYHSQSNGQCEKVNDIVLQGLRVHCRGLKDWPKMLAPIAAAYRAATIPSRGASPFKILYGVEMRLPVETTLGKLLPAHVRPTDNVDTMCKQLSLMRSQAQKLAQETRERGANAANKTRTTPEFQIGDRVYKTKDSLATDQDHKTAPRFEGPFVVMDRGPNNVYKLAHFHSGKMLRNYIHVSKIKSSAGARAAKRQTQTVNALNANKEPSAPKQRKTCDSKDHRTCEHNNLGERIRARRTIYAVDRDGNDLYAAFGHAGLDLNSESELECERGYAKAHSCDRHDKGVSNRPSQPQRIPRKGRTRRKPRKLCIIARLRG